MLDVLGPAQPSVNSPSCYGPDLWQRLVWKATQLYSYPGTMVNGSNGILIYVSIQYRLGLFGFLGGRYIAQNGRPEYRHGEASLALAFSLRPQKGAPRR